MFANAATFQLTSSDSPKSLSKSSNNFDTLFYEFEPGEPGQNLINVLNKTKIEKFEKNLFLKLIFRVFINQ
jgi:hypothetical protein